MKSRIWLLGLSTAFLAAGCGGSAGTGAQSQADSGAADSSAGSGQYVAPDARGIETVTVKDSPIPEYLELPAHIDADPTRVVHVYPPATGRIIEMKVRPWDHVAKGRNARAHRKRRSCAQRRGLSQGTSRQSS
jgi:multidrug efflux pump subunit AcrA (membrane-fusion protein)